MNNVEVDVFDRVARTILEKYPDAFISSEHVLAPSRFPAINIVETSNVEDSRRRDTTEFENASALVYTVNVYDNSDTNAKETCKECMAIISQEMRMLNMTRTMCSVVDNAIDPSVYRMTARYTGLVDHNFIMYSR